ncbi:hypothetical protein GUJ93_ZPchr0012g20092 [Zizania palustris]|uniref:Uncharacterized protein n=1 Tax=Zizania palustris TaxID=103762 RepID=A0A8J5WTU1_ZIZPA|nr:hypothetical protein GUJ93_ZPchr0012g20092 [Zizania palustris]
MKLDFSYWIEQQRVPDIQGKELNRLARVSATCDFVKDYSQNVVVEVVDKENIQEASPALSASAQNDATKL